MLEDEADRPLINSKLTEFADKTASELPAPGGGSISAYMGALGASLGTMVANLSSHKRGWDERWEEFSEIAEKGQYYKKNLLNLVDEDTNAFNNIMTAFRLPKANDEQKKIRNKAIQDATKHAVETPYKIMEFAYDSMAILKQMAETGLKASVSDAGVGALAAKAAISGAFLNVKINLSGLEDKEFCEKVTMQGKEIEDKAQKLLDEILEIVNNKITN